MVCSKEMDVATIDNFMTHYYRTIDRRCKVGTQFVVSLLMLGWVLAGEKLDQYGREGYRRYSVILPFQNVIQGVRHVSYQRLRAIMEKGFAVAADDDSGRRGDGCPAFGRQRFTRQIVACDQAI